MLSIFSGIFIPHFPSDVMMCITFQMRKKEETQDKENFIMRNFCTSLFFEFDQKWLDGRGI
jgi:hypothetical protein